MVSKNIIIASFYSKEYPNHTAAPIFQNLEILKDYHFTAAHFSAYYFFQMWQYHCIENFSFLQQHFSW